jgi:protein-disulfide isomerase
MAETTLAAPEHQMAVEASPVESPPTRQRFAPTWFLLGVLVGVIGLAAYTRLTAAPPTAALDVVALREAARDGTLDAIATLQADGSSAESRATSTPMVVKTAFAARPANQIGSQDAAVTIVEFSDFQ